MTATTPGHRSTLVADVRALMAAGRRFAVSTLEAVGLAPCGSCTSMPWECCCPMSVRQRNGWDHHDLNNLTPPDGFGITRAGRLPALPSAGRPGGDAAAELRQLVLTLEQLHDHALVADRAGVALALAQAKAAAARAGVA